MWVILRTGVTQFLKMFVILHFTLPVVLFVGGEKKIILSMEES